MGDVYCNDGGSNTSPYETWAKAATTLKVAHDFAPAGDDLWVQSDHNENRGGATTFIGNGTLASPVKVTTVKNLNEPPVPGDYESMLTQGTGKIDGKASGAFDILFQGFTIWTGLRFIAGDDVRWNDLGVNIHHDCKFVVDDNVDMGASQSSADIRIEWHDCDWEQVTEGTCNMSGGNFLWRGGTLSFNGGDVTTLFGFGSRASILQVEDVDLSALNVTDFVLDITDTATVQSALFKRCKVPVFTSGGIVTGAPTTDGFEAKFYSVSSADVIYQFKEVFTNGVIDADNVVYLNATYDGTNGYSAHIVSNANVLEWARPLKFKLAEIFSAANPTITVEFTNDGTTYQNDELWIEIEYPDATIRAFGKINRTSRPLTILTTPANVTTSSVSWTGTGSFSAEVKQKITVTISGGGAGIHKISVCLAKPNDNIYADPKVTLS